MQQRAARTQVRPDALLQAGDHDDLELAPDEGGRRGDEHRLGAALRCERVFGQLAREHLVDEARGRRLWLALDESLGGGEQCDGGVECAVRLFGEHARAGRLRRPFGGEAAAVPQCPEQLLDGAAVLCHASRCREELGKSPCSPRRGGVDRLESAGRGERLDEQFIASAVAAAGELLVAQCQAEPAQADAVEPAQRAGEHRDGELGGERLATEREGCRNKQRRGGGCVTQGRARRTARRRHVGEREATLERGHVAARAQHHGHRRPRDAVEQVALAEHGGDRLALGRVRRRLDAEDGGEPVAAVGVAGCLARCSPDSCSGVCDEGGGAMGSAERRADVGGRRAHDGAQLGPASVHGVERDASHRPAAEHGAERAEQLGATAAEPVARDVGVTEGHDRDPSRGERAEQCRGGLGGLLRVIDDEQPQLRQGAECRGCRGLVEAAAHDRRGVGRELGRVELRGAQLLFHVGVLGEELRRCTPLGPLGSRTEVGERIGVDPVLDGAHEEVSELRAEAAEHPHLGAERIGPLRPEPVADAAFEQLADDLVVLGAREERDRRAGVGTHELEGYRVGRAGERAARGDAEPHCERVAQRRCRRARRRHDEHLFGRVPEPLDPIGDEFDGEGRLAAAGRPEDRRVLALGEPERGVDG